MAVYEIDAVQTWRDFSEEMSRSKLPLGQIDGVAASLAAKVAAAEAVVSEMASISLMETGGLSLSILLQEDTPVPATSDFAQRERALWVQYVGVTSREYGTFRIPGPSYLLLAQQGTDEVDITSNVTAAAFVIVIEANVKKVLDNDTEEAVEVTAMRLVGRAI